MSETPTFQAQDEFLDLMTKAKAGDTRAHDAIYHIYSPIVRRHCRLHPLLRGKLDRDDVEQMVWACFFRLLHRVPCRTSRHLIGYLGKLTRNVLLQASRPYLRTKKRAAEREKSIDGIDQSCIRNMSRASSSFEEEVDYEDVWDRIFSILPGLVATEKYVMCRWRQGFSVKETVDDYLFLSHLCGVFPERDSLIWEVKAVRDCALRELRSVAPQVFLLLGLDRVQCRSATEAPRSSLDSSGA